MTTPREKILVADDSTVERKIACEALEDAGYDVAEAADGQQALEMFARDRPDLVMLDVVMPRLTGLETCRILKAKAGSSYLPVIMVSTRNSVNARVEGLRSGADDYLGKPYDAKELRARVEALLRTRRLLADAQAGSANGWLIDSGKRASSSAVSDELRDPPSRAWVQRQVEDEFDRAQRYGDPLACLRIEVDDFDAISSVKCASPFGHVMHALRDVVEASVRKIDRVFRVDERGYLLLLPNTHFPGALAVAERISVDARRIRANPAETACCTVSVGVSFFPNKETDSAGDLLDLVEAALERARGEEGGKICLFQHQGYLYTPEG